MLKYYNRFFVIFDKRINDKIKYYKNAKLIFGDNEYDDIYIYISKNTNFSISKERNVIVIGLCLDTINNTLDNNYITQTIFKLISDDINKFYDYIDNLNGRFLIIYKNFDKWNILNDAGGARSVWYNTNFNIIASHYYIVNMLHHEEQDSFFECYNNLNKKSIKGKSPWCLPGDLSPYENIKLLVPNHFIELNNIIKIYRYWPRRELNSNFKFNDIVEYISETLKKELLTLCSKYNVVSGLTCGNDSRISLAAMKNYINKVTFFTYHNSKEKNITNFTTADLNKNIEFAKDFAKRNNINFIDIDCTYKINIKLNRILDSMHYHNHMRNNIVAYRKSFPDNSICLRHIFTELIRTSYFNFPDYFKGDLQSHMIKWSQYSCIDEKYYDKLYNLYSDYIDKYDYNKIYNYNPGDIFYWEYRMGQWMCGAVLTENDLAFDTFIPCNTRSIIEHGLCLPKLLKDKNVLSDAIIEKLSPKLLEEYKYPNCYEQNYKLIDWFTDKSYGVFDFKKIFHYQSYNNGEYSYSINSNNIKNDKVGIFFKPRTEGAIIGFSDSVVYKGESVSFKTKYNINIDKTYNFIFNIYCFNTVYGYNGVSYNIVVDNKIIYELDTNSFCGRINQIIYNFKSDKNIDINIEIKLLAKKDLNIYYNGIIDIKNITLREENVFKNSYFIDSTYDRMRRT